jgi:carbon storage regulator
MSIQAPSAPAIQDDSENGRCRIGLKRGSTMLVLTRRKGETLNIGDEVQVTVLGIKSNQVRIGIDAPKNVPVHRQEVYERIKREEQEANTGERSPHDSAHTVARRLIKAE